MNCEYCRVQHYFVSHELINLKFSGYYYRHLAQSQTQNWNTFWACYNKAHSDVLAALLFDSTLHVIIEVKKNDAINTGVYKFVALIFILVYKISFKLPIKKISHDPYRNHNRRIQAQSLKNRKHHALIWSYINTMVKKHSSVASPLYTTISPLPVSEPSGKRWN